MRKILKSTGIVLILVVVLAVLTTSAAMAAKNSEPGTCPNPECPGDCDQTQTQAKDCLQGDDCTCLGDQTQTQAKDCLKSQDCTCDGVCDGDQTQNQAGEASLTQTQNAGELSKIKTQTKTGKVS